MSAHTPLESTWGAATQTTAKTPTAKTQALNTAGLGCASCGNATAASATEKPEAPKPAPPPRPAVNPHTQLIPVQTENEIKDLQRKYKSISVLCTMDGCGWCKKMLPEAEKAALSSATMPIAHLKAGPQSTSFLKGMGIRAFPTLCNLRANQSTILIPGFKTAETLTTLVSRRKN
jgi:hypothetical protein